MKLGLLVGNLLISTVAFGVTSNDSHIRGAQIIKVRLSKPRDLQTGTFAQNIDHAGLVPGQTFNQRYWVDSQYATDPSNAPVIYNICGEAGVDEAYYLDDNTIEWAKTLGAHLVYLEHRDYGQSIPFNDLSTDHLQYLTLNNVLEDLATFQKWLTTSQGWHGPWIAVGGSYSATLAALYRLKHPELVVGALAASAPMISGVGNQDDGGGDGGGLASTDPSNEGRSWVYEACTALGFWEADGPDPSSALEIPSSSLCQQLFANTPLVNSDSYNQNYDLPFLANGGPSNILFTYGTDDVWTNLGLSTQNNQNSGITILLIQGAGHHFDLNAPDPSDSAEVLQARAQFAKLAQQWIAAAGH